MGIILTRRGVLFFMQTGVQTSIPRGQKIGFHVPFVDFVKGQLLIVG